MKTKILLALLVSFAFAQISSAQKVKIKKGIAYVDKKPYVKVERESGNMSIYPLEGDDEIIFLKLHDPTPNNNQNLDDYYIVRFIDSGKEVEIDDKSRKGILKMIYKAKIVNKDGTLNEEKMKKFITKYGSDVSKNKLYINN